MTASFEGRGWGWGVPHMKTSLGKTALSIGTAALAFVGTHPSAPPLPSPLDLRQRLAPLPWSTSAAAPPHDASRALNTSDPNCAASLAGYGFVDILGLVDWDSHLSHARHKKVGRRRPASAAQSPKYTNHTNHTNTSYTSTHSHTHVGTHMHGRALRPLARAPN